MSSFEETICISVEISEQGKRIDKLLSENITNISRSQLQRLITSGNVLLDDISIINNSYKVKAGDNFQINIPPPIEANPKPENIPLDIVYEDHDLIVVNKPAGMTVHPAPGAYSGTLVNALLYHCKDNLSGIGGVKRPGIVHRLDKDTSGLLVVAKNDFTHNGLSQQFLEHTIERTYWAVVYGTPNPMNGRIEANIARSKYDRKKMAAVECGGKYAATNYRTIKSFGTAASLVECRLETGRTHQIRVHMSTIGCGLVGDKVYVQSKKNNFKFKNDTIKAYVNNFPRQALHAKSLGFIHPRTNAKISYSSEIPQDFSSLIATIEI